MLTETDTWTMRRQVSPEGRNRTEKLELMQENLKLAADTIDALRSERERLKDSLKFALESSSKEVRRKNEEQDSEYWRKVLVDHDRKIEKIEEMIKENRLEKNDWKELLDNYNKAKSELNEKDYYIEKIQKRSPESLAELKSELARRAREIESLNKHLKELMQEKQEWTKIYNVLLELAPDYLKTKSLKDAKNKSDWEKFSEIIANLTAEIGNTAKDFEAVRKFRTSGKASDAFINDLRAASSVFLEKVHIYSDWHDLFKHHLVCSKRFKNMIESHEYPEALLRVLRFVVDFLGSLVAQQNRKNAYERPALTRPSSRVRASEENYEQSRKGSPSNYMAKNSELPRQARHLHQHRSESAFKQTCWTQTSSNKSPLLVSDLNSRSNIGMQTSFDKPYGSFASSKLLSKGVQLENPSFGSQNTVEEQSSNFKSSKDRRHGSPNRYSKYNETSGNILIESRLSEKTKDEGYIKLFDESQQLLSIIDKQNSRLTKINNQISQLVPNKFDTILEKEEQDSSRKDLESSSRLFKYRHSGPKTIEYENGTFNNPIIISNSNTSEKFRKIARKYTEPQDSEEIERFRNKEIRGNLEQNKSHIEDSKYLAREKGGDSRVASHLRIEETDSDDLQSGRSTPRSKKKAGLESSALRIPPKESSKIHDSKNEGQSRRGVSPKDGRTRSPEMNVDRFSEWSRPILKKEECWGSMGDYFSTKPEESSSKS